MRLGVYGGSFDPVHYGHLLLAEQCREQCGLDEVAFIPAHEPPHKRAGSLADGRVRCDMLEFALAGSPAFRVDRRELARRGTSWTVETLAELRAEDPSRELFFLIGADSLGDLPTWREPERIAELARIVAVNRGDSSRPDRAAIVARLGERIAARIDLVDMPGCDFAARDIRERVRTGRSIRYLVPRAVEEYIREHGLYRDGSRPPSGNPATHG
jgi:nicotinate-nucleotide adenylyltransferase